MTLELSSSLNSSMNVCVFPSDQVCLVSFSFSIGYISPQKLNEEKQGPSFANHRASPHSGKAAEVKFKLLLKHYGVQRNKAES